MIEPFAITNHSRTRAELEEFWIFCLCVAGKRATTIAPKVADFIEGSGRSGSPFERIRTMISAGELGSELRRARLGKYALLERALAASVAADAPELSRAGPMELESIPGVGPKTARYFLLHTRSDIQVAVIDTHVLKYVKSLGHAVPKRVPTRATYARLERIVIDRARSVGMDLAAFDLAIWSHYTTGGLYPLPGGSS